MKARLIFATSMSVDSDILLVDEALATGDSYFVQKCSQRIQEICKSGATIVYVSHNLWHVQQICQRALLMDRGEILADGDPTSVVSRYHQLVFEKEGEDPLVTENQELKMASGTGEVIITAIRIKDVIGEETTRFYAGDVMNIELHYQSFKEDIHEVNLFVGFLSCKDFSYLGEINTVEYVEPMKKETKTETIKIGKKGVILVKVEPLLLLNNHYSLWVILYEKSLAHTYYSEYKNIKPFFVAKSKNPSLKGDAICWLPASITVSN